MRDMVKALRGIPKLSDIVENSVEMLMAKDAEISRLQQQLSDLRVVANYNREQAEAAEAREKQVRAETIEECAKVADGYRDESPDHSVQIGAGWIADDIRALASKEGGE